MVNYSNGKVYKVEPKCDHDEGEVYVGSTAEQYISRRFAQHLDQYRNKDKYMRNYTVFQLFDKYGTGNCQIVLLEDYPCSSKNELHVREGHYQRELKCVNKVLLGRTKSEYFQDHKEKFSKLHKAYAEEHKDGIKEYQNQYRIDNRELILAGKKAHYEANKERLAKQNKEYKQNNREMVRAKANAKIECECGCSVGRSGISGHRKSKKHKELMINK
jgi:hypothetical protein